jgi:hypothetical protein
MPGRYRPPAQQSDCPRFRAAGAEAPTITVRSGIKAKTEGPFERALRSMSVARHNQHERGTKAPEGASVAKGCASRDCSTGRVHRRSRRSRMFGRLDRRLSAAFRKAVTASAAGSHQTVMPPFGIVRGSARPDKTSRPVATDLTMASRSQAVSSEAHELLVARQEL